jgi:uncharacterized iron-regulated protein
LQLEVIKGLRNRGKAVAIGLEMFPAERQADLDAWVGGRISAPRFRKIFSRVWKMPWQLYSDIFFYARDYGIPLIGLNIPEKIAVKVGRSGFDSLTARELSQLPSGITCNVDQPYREFISKAFREHKIPRKSFQNFCEAQMLWNKGMAWHLASYLRRQPERVVAVLAGTGHAQRRGIPVELAGYLNVPVKIVLPDDHEMAGVSAQDADYLVRR